MSSKPKVVICGGGLAGKYIATQLDNIADVIVFEKKKTYYNNIGSLRAVVYPDFVNNLFIPYNNLLKNGKFVQAEVEEVSETAVKIRGLDKPVTFDYCIITVGSVYNFPGRVPWWIGNFACKKMFIECHAKLCNANRVTIVGGGPVAVELASEILDEFPNKNVTILHSGQYLMSKQGVGENIGRHVHSKLESMGCHIVYNEKIILEDLDRENYKDLNLAMKSSASEDDTRNEKTIAAVADNEGGKKATEIVKQFTTKFLREGERELKSTSGKTFKTDLTFFCIGPSFPCEVYENHFMTSKNYRCRTDNFMRALNKRGKSIPNVFVAGDCAGTPSNDGEGDYATYTFAQAHAKVIVKNIKKCIKVGSTTGFKLPCEYKTPKPLMLVSTGRNGGVLAQGPRTKDGKGSLLVNFCGINNYLCKTFKAKDLGTTQLHKEFKAGKPKPLNNPRPKRSNVKSAKVQPSKQYKV